MCDILQDQVSFGHGEKLGLRQNGIRDMGRENCEYRQWGMLTWKLLT